MEDRKATTPLTSSSITNALYVDNFMVAGHDPQVVGALCNRHTCWLNEQGLRVHEEFAPTTSCTFAGVDFDGEKHTARISLRRAWRLRFAIDH